MPVVCLDCRYIGPRPSGIATVVSALVEHLPALAPDWRFVLLRNPAAKGPLSVAANVSERVVRHAANGPVSMWLLPRTIDLSDIDLFHAPANILPAGLAMPSVTTVHDMMWLTDPDLCSDRAWGRVERHFHGHGMRRALDRSAMVMTVSEATRQAVLAFAPRLEGRVMAALPGVSPTFRPESQPPVEPPPRRYVLTVGQHAPYKNHALAIRGFALAFPGDDGTELVLLQRRGPGNGGLRALADGLGVGDRVRFLPPVDEARLAALYRGAAALLHPSLCEGFGMPIAEAMASGCPVITSDRSAMPEVAGDAAMLVDPTDPAAIAAALQAVVGRPDVAQAMVARGLARAAALDRRRFAEANLAAYRTVLGSG